MSFLKLPIFPSVRATLSRWAAELRQTAFLKLGDFIFTSYEPTISSSMTISAVNIAFARYLRLGNLVFVAFWASFTTGGVASPTITITLPPDFLVNELGAGAFTCVVLDGGNRLSGVGDFAGAPPVITVGRYDGANFGLGANRVIRIFGGYEIDSI